MELDIEKAKNMKLILSAFEQLSGLKINFHKSELFCFGGAQDDISCMPSFLVAGRVSFLLSIWVFRFIIGDLQLLNGKWWRRDYRLD